MERQSRKKSKIVLAVTCSLAVLLLMGGLAFSLGRGSNEEVPYEPRAPGYIELDKQGIVF